jgi:hypothetical protein
MAPAPKANQAGEEAMSGWRRVLELASDDAAPSDDRIRAFEIILLMHVSTRLWIWAMRPYPGVGASKFLVAFAVTVLALAALRRQWEQRAIAAIAVILLAKVVATFPQTSNHSLLELLGVFLLAFLDRRSAEERSLLVQASCWIVAIVLFYSGLQKVLYGTYFDAQFLGAFIALKPSFAQAFGQIMPAAELSRLQSLPIQVGAGPFAVNSLAVVVLSNSVYVVEIVVPILLLWVRTRTAAVVLAIAFTVALQTAARELLFGALLVNLLLLFPRQAVNRRLLPVFAVFYAFLLALRLFAPGVFFN